MSAHRALWDWTRYWLPHSSISNTLVSGLLPSTPAPDYSILGDLADRSLLVLLGEPGSGKSIEIDREMERIRRLLGINDHVLFLDGRTTVHSETTLFRMWFASEEWRTWLASSDDLWIFFDGFDESIQRISNLNGIIQHELSRVIARDATRTSRIFLRVASRTTGWQQDFGEALFRLLHPDEVGQPAQSHYSFHLAPLRWDDIEIAAASKGLNGEDFCERIREQGIEALALRPAQLDWLLNIFAAGGRFPEDKVQLYWEGMKQLCDDPAHRFDSEQLRAAAGRVAFATMFGGVQSLWLGADRGDVPASSTPLSSFVGGVEETSRDDVRVTSEVLRELVKSGLFTNLESTRAVWAHQTYPEYLAAKYLVGKRLPLSQMTGLVTNPLDQSQRIIPGMVESAAWMASMSPDVLSHLLHHDPGTLIESDVALAGPENRERLLRAFFASMESGQLIRTRWAGRGQYASLYFEGMEGVLQPFITNTALRKESRDSAIDIAVDCRLNELGEALAAIALNKAEPEVLRRSAAWTVTRLENDSARQSLKPLIGTTIEEDPFEELKGCAMRANWPIYLSIQDLLQHLRAPSWHGLGAYRLFLSEHFVQNIASEDLVPALEWLDQQGDWGERTFDLHELEVRLVRRAFEYLENEHVSNWIVKRAVSNLDKYKPLFGAGTNTDDITELLSKSERRRKLVNELSRVTSEQAHLQTVAFGLAELLRHQRAWIDQDFAWMVECLRKTGVGSASETFWLSILRDTFSVDTHEQTSILFELYSDARFSAQLADLFEPVDFRSPNAERQRNTWYILTGHRDQHDRSPESTINVEEFVVELLNRIEGGSPTAWWSVDDWLKVDQRGQKYERFWITDISELPGWHQCSSSTQQRIIDSAKAFLESHTPDTNHVGTASYSFADHAAYRALGLLLRERPHELDGLPAATWTNLGPVIMGMHPESSGKSVPNQNVLLQKAMDHGFDPTPWLIKMASNAKEESADHLSPALKVVVSLLSELQRETLVEQLIQSTVPIVALRESIKVLCETGVPPAFAQALRVVQELVEKPDGEQLTSRLTTQLLDFVSPENWNDLWPVISRHDRLFEESFLSFSHWHRDASEFARLLDERSVGLLYLKLVQHFPPSEDPNIGEVHSVSPRESLGHWREQLLSSLTMRGTWVAVEQIRGLAKQLPDIEWLSIRVAQAEEEARRRTWQPPTIEQLLHLAKSADSRIINSPGQLHDVIIESLGRLQHALLGESPAAVDLWNIKGTQKTGTPNDELRISDYMKRHFDRDLNNFGIVVSREVENRIGSEIDIYVQYVDPSSKVPITVFCEVKGCWHRDLYTSMSRQLQERYMKQQGLSHGIYVVAFFDGGRWDPTDYKRRHSRSHSFEDLRDSLTAQASDLTTDAFRVASFVLDCRY